VALTRKLGPYVVGTLLSEPVKKLRRGVAETRRRVRSEPHRVQYFHQVDDPYSDLSAQLLAAFAERYDVELAPTLVGPPPDAAAPERERLVAYARRDAADVAPAYGLEFDDPGEQPPTDSVELASRILLAAIRQGDFAKVAPRVGKALWSRETSALDALAAEHECAGAAHTAAAVARGNVAREKLGHYSGAMFYYAGEWYWGVDRLEYLEERLEALGARRSDAPEGRAIRCDRTPGVPTGARGEGLTLEFYASLRSPYTAIVFQRVFDLVDRHGVELSMRPVLPMVMRGLPVPKAKRFYIISDTRREADRIGVPFGFLADPLGRPVERGLSLWPCMREKGLGDAFLHAFARAAFSEGVDLGSDAGLRGVVEGLGVDWGDVLPHLDGEDWREEVEHNRDTLSGLGLWGVPSFRLLGPEGSPEYATWGQDRIWRVEQEIVRRLA
jgi:2-hydroxychromene-2-carboxylate isomerase